MGRPDHHVMVAVQPHYANPHKRSLREVKSAGHFRFNHALQLTLAIFFSRQINQRYFQLHLRIDTLPLAIRSETSQQNWMAFDDLLYCRAE